METNLSFVQFRPVFGDKALNLESTEKLIKQSKRGIIILPELFNTGYTFTSKREAAQMAEDAPKGETCRRLIELSGKMRSTIVAGFAEKSGSRVFNSALIASRGEFLGVYRKAHLFYKEKLWFSQGDTGFHVFNTKDGNVGVIICFDWIYPEATRILALAGAEVIAHPANLVLPGLAQKGMCIRALENRVFTITANRVGRETRGEDSFRFTGRSQIVSPKMKVLAKANSTETMVKSVAVDLSEAREKTITKSNDLIAERRTDLYRALT
jgi:predicted amidohydrolase